MKKCLVILPKYIQRRSPNAICFDALLAAFTEASNWHFTIITTCYDGEDRIERFQHADAVLLNDKTEQRLTAMKGSAPLLELWCRRLMSVLSPSYLLGWRKKAESFINHNLVKEEFDLLISNSLPIDSHHVAWSYKKKHPDTPWAAYILDPCSENPICRSANPIINHLRNFEEHFAYENCDKIILLQNISIPVEFEEKTCRVGIPLLREGGHNRSPYKDSAHDEANINITYGGSFLKGIREPDAVLPIIRTLEKYPAVFQFFTNIEDDVARGLSEAADSLRNLRVNGYVNKEALNQILWESGALLSIGNLSSLQIPSKVIEYMSFRKPLIHVCFSNADPVLPYLREYPLACIINAFDSVEVNGEKIRNFLETALAIDLSTWNPEGGLLGKCTAEYSVRELLTLVDSYKLR